GFARSRSPSASPARPASRESDEDESEGGTVFCLRAAARLRYNPRSVQEGDPRRCPVMPKSETVSRAKRGRPDPAFPDGLTPTWEIAYLYPAQGAWTEEDYF